GVDHRIRQRINAAYKEAGYAGDPADVLAGLLRRFQAVDICFCDFLISFLGEEQRNVDVDAFANKLANRGNTLGSSRDLDHDVRTGNGFPQTARFFNAAQRIAGERGRDFKTHIAVTLVGRLVNREQNVSGVLDVAHGNALIDIPGAQALRDKLVEETGVLVAADHR